MSFYMSVFIPRRRALQYFSQMESVFYSHFGEMAPFGLWDATFSSSGKKSGVEHQKIDPWRDHISYLNNLQRAFPVLNALPVEFFFLLRDVSCSEYRLVFLCKRNKLDFFAFASDSFFQACDSLIAILSSCKTLFPHNFVISLSSIVEKKQHFFVDITICTPTLKSKTFRFIMTSFLLHSRLPFSKKITTKLN